MLVVCPLREDRLARRFRRFAAAAVGMGGLLGSGAALGAEPGAAQPGAEKPGADQPGTPQPGAPKVQSSCARLDVQRGDELISRLQLTFAAAPAGAKLPQRLLIACDEQRAWLIWTAPPAELVPVAVQEDLVESVIAAVEGRLRRASVPAATLEPAETSPEQGTPAEEAEEARPSRTREAPVRYFTHGGIGAAGVIEWLPEPLSPPLGVRLDVGVGVVGALSFTLSESARVGSAPTGRTFGYDVGAGATWGAPFDARHNFGVRALVGVDWFSNQSGLGDSARSTGVAELGGTAALYTHDVALWLGASGRYRMSPQHFGSPRELALPHLSVLVTVGGALLVDVSRRQSSHASVP